MGSTALDARVGLSTCLAQLGMVGSSDRGYTA